MDTTTILDLADSAARSVRKQRALNWTHEDFEDARQEAAAGIVRALRDLPSGVRDVRAYCWRAGRDGATRSAFRSTSIRTISLTLPSGAVCEEGTAIESSSRVWSWQPTADQLATLRQLLYESRSKRGERGRLATEMDIATLRLLMDGRTQIEMASVLGQTKTTVNKRLCDLRQRLAKIGEEQLSA